jgi:hypothetical protein
MPQGLKPHSFAALCGPAKAVPLLQSRSYEHAWVLLEIGACNSRLRGFSGVVEKGLGTAENGLFGDKNREKSTKNAMGFCLFLLMIKELREFSGFQSV